MPSKPPSLPKLPVVKPPSLPRLPAVKPASLPKMAAVKPPSVPRMSAVTAGIYDGNATVEMPVVRLPADALRSEPPPPAVAAPADHPSSFPSSGKMLVFEVPRHSALPSMAPPRSQSSSPVPPPPSSLDAVVVHAPPSSAIVVTPTHEWLATDGAADGDTNEREEITDISSRNRATLVSDAVPQKRRRNRAWRASRVLPVLAVAAIACAVMSGKLHPKSLTRSAAPPPTPALAAPLVPAPIPEPLTVAAPPETTPAPEPEPTAAAAPAPPPDDKGRVSTEGTAPGRRIFIDERAVGETPNVVVVPCGSHRIRVGSRGTTTVLDVPCGGEVSVSDR